MARTTTSPELSPTRIWTTAAVRASDLVRVLLHRLLHPERGVARAHRVVLVGERRAEQRHDPVAHHLVDGALVAVDGLHHPLEHGVEELARLLGIAVGEQLHRALEVGEEHGDLLALALERALRGEDLLGEVLGGVGLGGGEAAGLRRERSPARTAELLARRDGDATARAGRLEPGATVLAETAPASFSAWHRGHVMPEPPSSLVGQGRSGGPRIPARVSRGQGHRRELPRARESPRPLGVSGG